MDIPRALCAQDLRRIHRGCNEAFWQVMEDFKIQTSGFSFCLLYLRYLSVLLFLLLDMSI
jgi:hypothetical protein